MLAVLLAGCSSVSVVKNPGPEDTGIRYYRPKPYLLVTPADATGRMVKLKVVYLPDYSEEYSITPKGKKPPQVQLEDGWNLVAVGGPAPPPKPEEPPPPTAPLDQAKVPEFVVAATNVPIGLYESVFDVCQGKKQLKGWRYVGMSPLGGGPAIGLDPSCAQAGAQAMGRNCSPNGQALLGPDGRPLLGPDGTPVNPNAPLPPSAVSGPLYGLVFFNGVMTFRQLDEIANNMTCPQYLRTIPEPVRPAVGAGGSGIIKEGTGARGTGIEKQPTPPPGGEGVAPPNPQPNPPTIPPGGLGQVYPAEARPDVGVSRTGAKSKIPPPRIWDLSRKLPEAP
jgi:hypothetical protein